MPFKNKIEAVNQYIVSVQDELLADLKSLIGIPSITYQEGNAVEFLAQKMRSFGFDEVKVDPVGNLLGRVGSGKPVFLYDAHIDTVGAGELSDWAHPPFEAEFKNGILSGRGAVDDKGCLMAITYAARALKALNLDKGFTLWVSASVAEEDVEGSCVAAMMKESPDLKPDYILVAEASENRIIRGHKGRALIQITIPGKAAHASAAWHGENALIKALPVVERIDGFNAFIEDPFLGKGTIEVTNLLCDTPSLNTIPGKATIICDRRISCAETQAEIIREAENFIRDIPGAKAAINTEKVTSYTGYQIECEDYFPSWVIAEEHPLIQAGVKTYELLFNKKAEVTRWDFCTNATHLCGRTGIPSMGFGPGEESLCHTSQDQVSFTELLDALRFYVMLPLVASHNS
ncbi:MAG: YgeY family selenium metabolism-linked hydrolase [Anaerolineaceae bacterium]|nr:YgeY family selenium metabolism-linked hydrolase [Anaerolineaceae bacterium]